MEEAAMSKHDRHHCKHCGKALVEGRAYELGGYRWHVECFLCSVCGRQLNADTNMLVLGNGTLVCNNCSYYCSICHRKIENLAILTNDQAFCSHCFVCRNCKRPIDDLKYARTPHGIFCMTCHNLFMARKHQRQSRRVSSQSRTSVLRDKQLPELPGMPRKDTSRTSSSSTIPHLGSPLAGGGTPGRVTDISDYFGLDNSRSRASIMSADSNRNHSPLSLRDSSMLAAEGASPRGDNRTASIIGSDSSSEYETDPADWVKPDHPVGAENILDGLDGTPSDSDALAHVDASCKHSPIDGLAHDHHHHIHDEDSHAHHAHAQSPSHDANGASALAPAKSIETTRSPDAKVTSAFSSPLASPTYSPRKQSPLHSPKKDVGRALDLHPDLSYNSVADSPTRVLTAQLDKDPSPSLSLGLSSLQPTPVASPPAEKLSTDLDEKLSTSSYRSAFAIPPRSPARSPIGSPRSSPLLNRDGSPSRAFGRDLSPSSFHSGLRELSPAPSNRSNVGTPVQHASNSTSQTDLSSPAELQVPKRSTLRGRSNAPAAFSHHREGSATSAPGPVPTSPRWNKSAGIGLFQSSSTPVKPSGHKRSFSENPSATKLDPEALLRGLMAAQAKISELESKLSKDSPKESAEDDNNLRDIILERKRTIAGLEARQAVAREELEALSDAKHSGAHEEQLGQFSAKLSQMKMSLESDISELSANKEKLINEIENLRITRDKALEESSLLNIKNTQLVDMNNELLKQTLEKFGPNSLWSSQTNTGTSSAPSSATSPPRLPWEKRNKAKRKEVGSGTQKPSSASTSSQSSSNHLLSKTENFSPYARPPISQSSTGGSQAPSPGDSNTPFVTSLDSSQQQERKDRGGTRNIWPWRRIQRGQNRVNASDFKEIDISSSTPVTKLSGTGGVTQASTGASGLHKSALLGESLTGRTLLDELPVPLLVTRCIEEVEKRGLDFEGIYRKSGSKMQVDAIMEYFETKDPEKASTLSGDISAVTSTLKQYLRYLKDPVINYQSYDAFVNGGRAGDIGALREVISGLPPSHRMTLEVLMRHLVKVKEHGEKNLMNTQNLATVFAPTLTRDQQLDREMTDMQAINDATQMLIDNASSLFT